MQQCLEEAFGGPEVFLELISAEQPDEEALFALFGAALACETGNSKRAERQTLGINLPNFVAGRSVNDSVAVRPAQTAGTSPL